MKKQKFIYLLTFLSISGIILWWTLSNDHIPTSKKISIAILDSGISSSEKNVTQYNVIESKKTNDEYGHGTGVFHILKNRLKESGTWDNSTVYSIKVMDNKGNVTKKDFIEGINYAIENNVNLINISFGFNHDDPKIRESINRATMKGILIIGSAGNRFGMQSDYPARYKNVISVNAYDTNEDRVPRYAAKGKIDFIAPGDNVVTKDQLENKIKVSGSSFAAPYITATLASYIAHDSVAQNDLSVFLNNLDKHSTLTKEMESKKEYVGAGMLSLYSKGENL
ncbi:S8 family peptidase [Exiguobacterium acetylicum]|uniref:S8 family peptidase n=1 Tax=Exiguobacterium acetylicum TaxID=41170 RepID=UPI001CA696BD|nr:S8 family serine peptidase [Exiguobacterium acetylicum]QZY88560.1 S8 family serine peptidase [Exiguobacterium acetylicum]